APPPFLLHPRQYAFFVHLHFVFFLHSAFPHPSIIPSPSSSSPFSVILFPPQIHFSILSCPLLFTSFDCTNHLTHKFSLYFLISRFLACILFSRWGERIYAVWICSWNVCMIFGRSMGIRRRRLEGI